MSLDDLPPEIFARVLRPLPARDVARLVATHRSFPLIAEPVLRWRSAERLRLLLWRSTRGVHPVRPSRPNLEIVDTDNGFLQNVAHLAWLEETTLMLESDFHDRAHAVERLGRNPLLLERYVGVVLQIMYDDENANVRLAALKALGKLDAVLLVDLAVAFERMLLENISDEFDQTAMQILCKIDAGIVVRIMTYSDVPEIQVLAVLTLGKFPGALVNYAREVVHVMRDENREMVVQRAALETLAKLDPDLLLQYGDDIERMIWTIDFSAFAWQTLAKLGPEVLDRYVLMVVDKFTTSPVWRVRADALEVFGYIDPALLELYAENVADQLKHDNWAVRCTALQVLSKVELHVLLDNYGDAVLGMLEDSDPGVRCQALETLEPAAVRLEPYARAVVFRLKDTNPRVRETALRMLGKSELGRYTGDVVGMLMDTFIHVQAIALEILRTREPTVLQLYAGAVVDMLKSDRFDVFIVAMQALSLMPQVVIEQHIDDVVRILMLDGPTKDALPHWMNIDVIDRVRRTALRTLQRLESVDLAKHTVVLVRALSYPQVGTLALKILSYIAPTDLKPHAVEMVREGAIGPLVVMLDSIVHEVRMSVISVLKVIASVDGSMDVMSVTPTGESVLVMTGIIPMLVLLLYTCMIPELVLEVMQTLWYIAAHSTYNCEVMVDAKVITYVIDILCDDGDAAPGIEAAAELLLEKLSRSSEETRLKITLARPSIAL